MDSLGVPRIRKDSLGIPKGSRTTRWQKRPAHVLGLFLYSVHGQGLVDAVAC